MLFVDVDNWYCRYQHVRAIRPIVDINNLFYCIHALLISTIGLVNIINVLTLLISTNLIVDITDAQSQQYQLLISTIRILNIDNSTYQYPQFQLSLSLMHNRNNNNCWYQQIIADIHNSDCGYRQFGLWISTIQIADVDNYINN